MTCGHSRADGFLKLAALAIPRPAKQIISEKSVKSGYVAYRGAFWQNPRDSQA
jgi:hypothetical protein